MANEITYTGTQGANQRAAEVFNTLLWENLCDRIDLRSLGLKLGDVGGSGSDTLATPTVTLADPMNAANTNETTAFDNDALVQNQFSVSVAQQIISYSLTDKFMITGAAGQLDLGRLAQAAADAYSLRVTDMVCGIIDSFATTVGTTTVDLTTDEWFDAMFGLEQNIVPGPYAAVLFPTQYTDLQSSLRSEGGAVQFLAATGDQLALRGPGFKGSYLGVDIWTSDSVATANAGADSAGAMFGAGAWGYVEASAKSQMPGSIAASVPAGSPVYAEFARTADPGLSRIVAHAFVGVSAIEDLRGVSIITDR